MPDKAMGMKGLCAQCGQVIEVTERNTIVVDADEDDQHGEPGVDRCARCRKPLRGDWDRYRREEGVVCNICANQAVNAPARLQSQPDGQPAAKELYAPPSIGPLEDERFELPESAPATRQQSDAFRLGLYVAAFSVVGLGLLVALTDPGPPSETSTGTAGGGFLGPPQELIEGQGALAMCLIQGVRAVFTFVPFFVALLTTLYWTDRWPRDGLLKGLPHLMVVSFVLAGEIFLVSVALGAFMGVFGWVAAYAIALVFVWSIYGLKPTQLIAFAGTNLVIRLLLAPLSMLAYKGLGVLIG